jgi:hypothetical protein
MLKKYVSKFAMDIFPSVAATIIGAYVVNHYIVGKPAADAPAAASLSSADPKKADTRNDAKPSETPSDVANIPEAGIKAKGISEKAILEKPAVEKPAEKPVADRPAETASVPVESRRHQPAPREKSTARTIAAPVQPAAPPTAAPVVAPPPTAPGVEAATTPEERRDANDLARAAIERLRGANDGSPRAQESARIPDSSRIPDQPRVVSVPPVAAPSVRPLPSPVMISTPGNENLDSPAAPSQRPPYAGATRVDNPARPTPPADIPAAAPPSGPLDLHAEAAQPSTREHTTVADDMLSAAKSVFQAVLPK